MNAESERASLPDRVEAAARLTDDELSEVALHAEQFTLYSLDGECAICKMAKELRERRAADACEAERAVDDKVRVTVHRSDGGVDTYTVRRERACEAERNPNTTDDECGEQVGWRWRYVNYSPVSGSKNGLWHWAELADDPTESMKRDEDDMLEVVPVFRRRPVSSEDVHREATE